MSDQMLPRLLVNADEAPTPGSFVFVRLALSMCDSRRISMAAVRGLEYIFFIMVINLLFESFFT